MKTRKLGVLSAVVLSWLLLAVGCSEHGMVSAEGETALLSVFPGAGAVSVDANTAVRIQFSRPLMSGMEEYTLLHRGDITGPVVARTWSLGEGRTVLHLVPEQPLQNDAEYTVHLGGGMMDESGRPVNLHRPGVRVALRAGPGGGLPPGRRGRGADGSR